MTAPMFLDAQGLRDLSQRVSKTHVRGDVEQQMTIVRASVELDEASRRLDVLAAVTAERDQARQMLADAPHDVSCAFGVPPSLDRTPHEAKCFCWKARL